MKLPSVGEINASGDLEIVFLPDIPACLKGHAMLITD